MDIPTQKIIILVLKVAMHPYKKEVVNLDFSYYINTEISSLIHDTSQDFPSI
jgi:hypothetical protein